MLGIVWRLAGAWILLSAFLAPTGLGWGPVGHRVIALAAEDLISARVDQRLRLYLDKESRLVDISTWSLEVLSERPETLPWNRIGIRREAERISLERDCPAGQCLPVKLRECIGIVRLGVRPQGEITDYLKMLVGLSGDIQQPALTIGPPERSRTSLPVIIGDRSMTILEAWEEGIVEAIGSEEEALGRVRAAIGNAGSQQWKEGTLRDWTWENHLVAREHVYPMLAGSGEIVIDGQQLEGLIELVIERLAKSSVRLAEILGDIWPR